MFKELATDIILDFHSFCSLPTNIRQEEAMISGPIFLNSHHKANSHVGTKAFQFSEVVGRE